jgi:hypothetical protein
LVEVWKKFSLVSVSSKFFHWSRKKVVDIP